MSPEPDFDRIVERIALRTGAFQAPVADVYAELAEQLRQVWNARGAADADAVDTRLSTLTGWVTSEPYRVQLREAIRSVDR